MIRNINSINSDLNTYINHEVKYPRNNYLILCRKHQGSIIRICGKIFYYFLHLLLISLFETLFYFYYISKEEDEAILENLLGLSNSMSNKCNLLPLNYRIEIINILNNLNNTEYINAFNLRKLQNNDLFNYSMTYIYSFIVIVIILGIVLGYIHNNRLKWKMMIIDTLIMILILGIFEYNFFINIVKKYTPITKEELEYNIENQLIKNCS